MSNQRDGERVLWEMIHIILACAVLIQVILLVFAGRKLYVSVGLWIGVMVAIYMPVYMYRVLWASLGGESRAAQKYVRMHSIIRYISVLVVFGIVIFTHIGSPLACFGGILTLKVAAYLQPVYRSLKERRNKEVK